MCEQEQISVIIVAGGQGTRFKSETPKQFTSLNEAPILYYTIAPFLENSMISQVVVVLPKDELQFIDKLRTHFSSDKISGIVGGSSRQASVLCGLKAVGHADKVLIHDGARPLVSTELIDRCLASLKTTSAACPVVPVVDSLVCAPSKQIENYVDRTNYFRVQSPQGFDFKLILEAHQKAEEEGLKFTDDCSLALHYGQMVTQFEGDPENIKISTPIDLLVIQSILKAKSVL